MRLVTETDVSSVVWPSHIVLWFPDCSDKVVFTGRSFVEGATHMRNEIELTEAGRQYAAAYAPHYTGRASPLALQLYRKLMASHPIGRESHYSRTQIQNIVHAVVPNQ